MSSKISNGDNTVLQTEENKKKERKKERDREGGRKGRREKGREKYLPYNRMLTNVDRMVKL